MMNDPVDISSSALSVFENPAFVDIRPLAEFEKGTIPGSIHLEDSQVAEAGFSPLQPVFLFGNRTQSVTSLVNMLREKGIEAYALNDGYPGWVLQHLKCMNASEVTHQAELSLQKKFRKNIWCSFTKAIREYELVKPGDSICVCISGGKDSMLMAKLFQQLKVHNKFPFEIRFLVMDPGYSSINRKIIQENLRLLNIPAVIRESPIFDDVYTVEKNPCYLCARMRRGYLYKYASELGCNKIALGHHYDDVIETILMGMLYGGQMQSMMPKLHSTNYSGMELIRPMYLIRERDIKSWRDSNDLHFLQCACHFTENNMTYVNGQNHSKRQETKEIIQQLLKINPAAERNIFASVSNVSLDTMICYKQKGQLHHFLDTYDQNDDDSAADFTKEGEASCRTL